MRSSWRKPSRAIFESGFGILDLGRSGGRVRLLILMAFVLVLGVAGCGSSGADSKTETTLPTKQVAISNGGKSEKVILEIAATAPQREQGLMYRQEMADDHGMLFVFPDETTAAFWMKNTYIPLDIAFVSAQGEIVDILPGKPLDETLIAPRHAYLYAIEMNQGWFAKHGLGLGSKVELPAGITEVPGACIGRAGCALVAALAADK